MRRLNRISTSAWLLISDSYAERIKQYIKEAEKNPDILNTRKLLPPDYRAMGICAELFTKSLLLGLDSSLRKNAFAEENSIKDIENLPFYEAVEFLKKRSVLAKNDYYSLSDRMKFRSFTVSRINDGRLLEKINAEMISNIRDGKGLKDFLSMSKSEILDRVGMGANQGWYWETVYRTNVQTAYNAGRVMGFEEDPPLALEFVGINDSRQTETCSSLSGIIRPFGDPFWETHTPPLHFNCRSTLRGIYDEEEIPEAWSNIADVENGAKGFGSWPLSNDSWWNELKSQTRAAKYYGVQGEIEKAKIILGLAKNLDVDDFEMMAGYNEIEKEIADEIISVIKEYEKRGDIYINDFYFGNLQNENEGIPILQIEPYGDYQIRLNVNKDFFAGRTLEEINNTINNAENIVAKNLKEATIHECGHAKSIYRMTIEEIEKFYKKIENANISGISRIAEKDGAEALAEIEVLLYRKSQIPEDALAFYNKYMRKH
ncbi:phage head morphogenesis protein [Treponema pectinovorum]|uniref:phage head morphogenesis protein n=1 Tax=Treponema pectinovorum TaxID=164 RepID=UPI0011CC5B62|nr:phage minor head protein [Treponema pectinovorum]